MKKTTVVPVLAAVLVYMIYGGAYLPINILSKVLEGDVLRLLAFRFGVATLAVLVLAATGVFRLSLAGKDPRPLLVSGALYPVLYYLCETYGLQQFPSGKAGVMMATVPLFAALMAAAIFDEHPGAKQWLSVMVGVAGAAVLNLGSGMEGGTIVGFLLICGTVLTCASSNIAIRSAYKARFSSTEITAVTTLMGAVFFGVLSVAQHAAAGTLHGYFAPLAQPKVLVCILYLSVVSSTFAVTVMNRVISQLPIVVTCGMVGVSSVVAVLCGVLVLHEQFTLTDGIGMAAVLAGSFGVSWYQKRPAKTEQCPDEP